MASYLLQIGCFKIYRVSVAPPNILLLIIWLELDVQKGQFSPQVSQVNNLTAIGAINLLFYLQKVILQDLVVLHKIFLSSPIQNYPAFQYKAYLPFTRKVKAYLQQEEEGPSQLLILYQAVPAIIDYLKTIDARVYKLQALLNRIAESQQAQSLQL